MQLPEPQSRTFSSLIEQIESGKIKIPQFQRNFVWTMQKSAGLIDSIVKGYPIGTFIFWETKEQLRSIRNIGDHKLPEVPDGESVYFVLDGQQRLTSLFACLKGIKVSREKNEDNFSKIYIDLDAEENQPIAITDVGDKDKKTFISILDLMKEDFAFLSAFPDQYHKKISNYRKTIDSYQYSTIQLRGVPLDIATEVFTRINVSGQSLTLFEIMVAKTFDEKNDFDLSEKYQDLVARLEQINYETISDTMVLQAISMIMVEECKRSVILKLDKQEFIEIWDKVTDAIERATEYFKGFYRIPVSQLLPYKALIVPFSYFFYKHNDKPTGDKQKRLEDFFWRCSLSGRYSVAVESRLAQDINRIKKILNDELPSYDCPIDTSAQFIQENGWFSAGRSYVKAILCIYTHFEPKSFIDNSIVNVSNNWLKQANSKNYHHFFPRSYMKDKDTDQFYANHVLNITIVDDFLNKRKIGSKPPSIYMKEFIEANPQLSETMKTHLIGESESFGIWEDNYEKFINARANLLSNEIDNRIIKQEIDTGKQTNIVDDIEEDITVTE